MKNSDPEPSLVAGLAAGLDDGSELGKPVYANWWSRALFAKDFEKQFFIPIPRTALQRRLFQLIERVAFSKKHLDLKIDRPIFIVGLPRSGTTLLYNLLCAHEEAAFVTNSINSFTEAICSIEWLRKALNLNIRGERFLQDSIDTDFGSPSEPIMFWGKWAGRNVEDLFWNEMRGVDLPEGKLEEIYDDVRKILYTFGARKGGSQRRFICKYPVFQTELKFIQDVFPDARFIHIVRDPRPTANSLVKLYHLTNQQIERIKHPWVRHVVPYPRVQGLKGYVEKFGAADVRTTAHVWQDAVNLVRETAPELKNYTEIRYEDLVSQPRVTMDRLFQFCQLAPPKSDAFKTEFGLIGKLRHKNQYSQFDVIESITRETMKTYDYGSL